MTNGLGLLKTTKTDISWGGALERKFNHLDCINEWRWSMLTNKHFELQCVECGNAFEQQDPASHGYVQDCPKCGGFCRVINRWGTCVCGEEIEFSGFTNTCECGRDYNSSGQELAPRSQWGEETGESLADILSIK